MRNHVKRLAPLAAAAASVLALPSAAGAAVTPYQTAVKTSSPSVYWTLDDTAGPVADASGHGRNGTASATVAFGKPGAFTFANSSAELPGGATITGEPGSVAVVELWVRPSAKGAQTVAAQGGWQLAITSKKRLVVKTGATTVDPKIVLPVGAWSMVDVAFAGSKVWFVTNGGLTKSREMKAGVSPASGTLTLGQAAATVGRRLDEVALYASAPASFEAFKTFAAGHFNAAKLPLNQTPPAVTVPAGGPVDGQTLTATSGTWSGTPTSYSYAWLRCDIDSGADQVCDYIDGATTASYTVRPDDLGTYLMAEVTAKNGAGSNYANSAAAAAVKALTPTISGTADEGEVLTAHPHTSNGATLTWTYQWQRCLSDGTSCNAIAEATNATYTLVSADAGQSVRVVATTVNTYLKDVSAASAPTPEVTSSGAPVAAPVNNGVPTVDGVLQAGQSLTASAGLWSANPAPDFAFQWLQCDAVGAACAPIDGATGTTYTLAPADVDHTIAVQVTADNHHFDAVHAQSAPTGLVKAAPAPGPGDGGSTPGGGGSGPGTTPGTNPGGGTNPGTNPGSGVGCAVRLAVVPKAKRGKVRGLGKVTLRLKRTKAGALRLVVKAKKGKVRKVAFKLDTKVLKGKKRVLNRKLRLKGLTAGRHVARVKITPKRGKAKTLKLALKVTGC